VTVGRIVIVGEAVIVGSAVIAGAFVASAVGRTCVGAGASEQPDETARNKTAIEKRYRIGLVVR
jgi:hypothetical protein